MEVGRQKAVERMTRSDRETGRMRRKRKRGGAKLAPSPLERRREKELLLHLGPEGAPWGQPSETRALWTRNSKSHNILKKHNSFLTFVGKTEEISDVI